MTRIRATCPTCGEVELRPDDVVLHRIVDAAGSLLAGTCYRFSCPECSSMVEKPADDRVADLLTSGGVPTEDVVSGPARPLRPLHPELPPDGPPLTLDDLLDLHFALHDDHWFERLAAGTPR